EYKAAQVQLSFLQARQIHASRLRDTLKSKLAGIPDTEMRYQQIARNAETTRTLYHTLLGTYNSVTLESDRVSGNIIKTQTAIVPDEPFRPKLWRDMLFGGAIGLFLSLVALLVLEQSDKRVRSVSDIRRLVSGPIVGTMPKLSRANIRRLI